MRLLLLGAAFATAFSWGTGAAALALGHAMAQALVPLSHVLR